MLFMWQITRYPHAIGDNGDTMSRMDMPAAIVVLTGSKGRIEAGLTQLRHHPNIPLMISGVGSNLSLQELLNMQDIPSSLQNMALQENERIHLGYKATSTIENAQEVMDWLHTEAIPQGSGIALVTAYYHMPRSLLEMQHATQDYQFSAYILPPPQPIIPLMLQDVYTRTIVIQEFHKYLLAWLRLNLLHTFTT